MHVQRGVRQVTILHLDFGVFEASKMACKNVIESVNNFAVIGPYI